MCIDTEHLYARGVDLWDQKLRSEFIDNYGHFIELVHLNAPDEGVALGSFVDKHSMTLESHTSPSDGLVKDLVGRYPAVVERRSLVVSEKDVAYVNSLVPSGTSGMEKGLDEEIPQDVATDPSNYD